jgi:hypothetical protein
MKSSVQQLRTLHRFLSRHRKQIALLVLMLALLAWAMVWILRDPFREDVFNRIEIGMAFVDVQGMIERSGLPIEDTSAHEIFMGSRHTFFSRNRMLSVDLARDGRVVGKDYEVRPSQGDFWSAIQDWIREAFRRLGM